MKGYCIGLIVSLFLNSLNIYCQQNERLILFDLQAKENIKEITLENKNLRKDMIVYPVIGTNNNTIFMVKSRQSDTSSLFELNENNFNLIPFFSEFYYYGKYFDISCVNSSIIVYSKYANSWNYLTVLAEGKEYIYDSINENKYFTCRISSDNKFLVVNSLHMLVDYYQSEIDDKFCIYSIDSIKKGIKSKIEIPCKYCTNGWLVGNVLFFTKVNEIDDMHGFSLTDIYMAPFNNLNDTTRIARFSDIKSISPDGKYILGTRQKDFANDPLAVFDVENKKYQLLLGRQYSNYQTFYSTFMKKFAVFMNNRILYLDFPKEFPYDALHKGNPVYPWSDGLKIMKLLEYPTFSE